MRETLKTRRPNTQGKKTKRARCVTLARARRTSNFRGTGLENNGGRETSLARRREIESVNCSTLILRDRSRISIIIVSLIPLRLHDSFLAFLHEYDEDLFFHLCATFRLWVFNFSQIPINEFLFHSHQVFLYLTPNTLWRIDTSYVDLEEAARKTGVSTFLNNENRKESGKNTFSSRKN